MIGIVFLTLGFTATLWDIEWNVNDWCIYFQSWNEVSWYWICFLSQSNTAKQCRTNSILISRMIILNHIKVCTIDNIRKLIYSCSYITNQISQKESHWSISKSRFHSWFDGTILLSSKDIAITTLLIKCSHERIIVLYNGWWMIELAYIEMSYRELGFYACRFCCNFEVTIN